MLHAKRKVAPPPLETGSEEVATLIDTYFNAYNAARLREACQLIVKMIDEGALIGVSLSGALTPAGLSSILVPMMRAGYIDYLSSTGANLYHDLHFDLGFSIYRGTSDVATGAQDVTLRKEGIIRIYDLLFPADVLYKTDEWVYRVLLSEEFRNRIMGTSELHNRIGKYALETAKTTGARPSLLATAYDLDLPVYCPSPGDSTLGMNVAALWASGKQVGPHVDPSIDVTEMAGIVLDGKRAGHASGVIIFGGGAPKNFLLQTEPQIQEILGISEKGHDYFVQFTDARPDTGGLSGATPNEAVSWGKIDPDKLPGCAVCYVDSTVVMPLVGAYILARTKRREPRRIYKRLGGIVSDLKREYEHSEPFKRYFGK